MRLNSKTNYKQWGISYRNKTATYFVKRMLTRKFVFKYTPAVKLIRVVCHPSLLIKMTVAERSTVVRIVPIKSAN